MIFIDLFIIIMLVLGFLEGWKKGLLTSVVKLVSSILIFALAILLKKPISLILIENLPFFSFGGIFKDITILNVLVYEAIAFVICVIVLNIIFSVILKLTGVLNKFINATVILGLPNKLGGAIVNTLRFFIISFICIFVASLIPLTSSYIKDATLANGILEGTPILSNATKNINSTISEVYELAKSFDNSSDGEKINKEAYEIMIRYGIVSTDTARNLVNSGKLDAVILEEIETEYKSSIE